MYRVKTSEHAASLAKELKLSWGCSVFGPGGFYVGTRIELERIGVPDRDMRCEHERKTATES